MLVRSSPVNQPLPPFCIPIPSSLSLISRQDFPGGTKIFPFLINCFQRPHISYFTPNYKPTFFQMTFSNLEQATLPPLRAGAASASVRLPGIEYIHSLHDSPRQVSVSFRYFLMLYTNSLPSHECFLFTLLTSPCRLHANSLHPLPPQTNHDLPPPRFPTPRLPALSTQASGACPGLPQSHVTPNLSCDSFRLTCIMRTQSFSFHPPGLDPGSHCCS